MIATSFIKVRSKITYGATVSLEVGIPGLKKERLHCM